MARTYCNPLPIPNFDAEQPGCDGFQSLADPTIIEHGGRYYLYASAAQAWVSDDLVDWHYQRVDLPVRVIGPATEEHSGWFYLVGNGAKHFFRSRHPLGPWEDTGPMLDQRGEPVHWADLFLFRDDDGRMFAYHHSGSGVGADGIYVTELDPAADFRRAKGPSVRCFGYDPSHAWERWGDANEFPDVAWIEGPWVTKHDGVYHLQYSGCGTEWDSYAIGVYQSSSPTGPFAYVESSPILRHSGGLIRGTGHHAMARDKSGKLWMLYHVLFGNTDKFDRRLALDPVGFDERGRMFVGGPSERAALVPGVASEPARSNDAGLWPLTRLKPVTASSHLPGRPASYAVDHYVRSWWEAADESRPQWLQVDLQGAFVVCACRLIFPTNGLSPEHAATPFRYRLEVSDDGRVFRPAFDKSESSVARTIEYDEFEPTTCRHARVVLADGPAGRPLGLIDFTLFGKRAK